MSTLQQTNEVSAEHEHHCALEPILWPACHRHALSVPHARQALKKHLDMLRGRESALLGFMLTHCVGGGPTCPQLGGGAVGTPGCGSQAQEHLRMQQQSGAGLQAQLSGPGSQSSQLAGLRHV